MHITELLRLCADYSALGWSVQGQLQNLMAGDDLEEMNPAALQLIQKLFEKAARYKVEDAAFHAECIEDYLEHQ